MAQNLVLAWLGGARLFELKTVQVLDDLEIARPCIDMQTIGYNIEWSQELTVAGSVEEYTKAWMLIEILKRWEPIRDLVGDDPGPHVFDMSVGYDLEGIRTPKVAGFIDAMHDASAEIERLRPQNLGFIIRTAGDGAAEATGTTGSGRQPSRYQDTASPSVRTPTTSTPGTRRASQAWSAGTATAGLDTCPWLMANIIRSSKLMTLSVVGMPRRLQSSVGPTSQTPPTLVPKTDASTLTAPLALEADVVIVGAGPAGLAAAHRLAMLGHEVTIYDAHAKPGGLNEYGIASYKAVGGFAQAEVEWLMRIGGIDTMNGAEAIAAGADAGRIFPAWSESAG